MPTTPRPHRAIGNTRGPLWKGPTGLTPKQKKNWCEKQRQARLREDPAWVKKERDRCRRKNEREQNAKKRTAPAFARDARLTIIGRSSLRNPRFTWMDTNGVLHFERELSAEQLIAAWQREQRRKEKSLRQAAPRNWPR